MNDDEINQLLSDTLDKVEREWELHDEHLLADFQPSQNTTRPMTAIYFDSASVFIDEQSNDGLVYDSDTDDYVRVDPLDSSDIATSQVVLPDIPDEESVEGDFFSQLEDDY